jgi:hypothetical protein
MAMKYNEKWFSEVSLEAFSYLTQKFGFSAIELPQPCNEGEMPFYTILFKNKRGQFVLLTLAPTQHQMELSFGTDADAAGDPQEIYLYEYLKLVDPDGHHKLGWGPSTPDLLKDEVTRAAKILEKYGDPFLQRHETFWADIEAKRKAMWVKKQTQIKNLIKNVRA